MFLAVGVMVGQPFCVSVSFLRTRHSWENIRDVRQCW